MKDAVIILGARGSVPASGSAYAAYGGATTCFLLRLRGRSILVDAGSGLMNLPEAERRACALSLLLTHPHADHLIGLPLCPYAMVPGKRLDIYAARHGGLDAREQIRRLISPPLWPVAPESLPAEIRFYTLPPSMALEEGEIQVESMPGVHPGGVSLLRLSGGGKSVAVFTDCTLTQALAPEAAAFASACDLLLCDGHYSEKEWPRCAGFGHSTWIAAARFGRLCGAKRVLIVHHAPFRTDAELDAAAEDLKAIHPACTFAREGEEVSL